MTPSSDAVCRNTPLWSQRGWMHVWLRVHMFMPTTQVPCEWVCVPKQLSEWFSQQRQKGEQSAPADTLSGTTQKACLEALNLNTQEHRGGDGENESLSKRCVGGAWWKGGVVWDEEDAKKEEEEERRWARRSCISAHRGTPQGHEGRMLWGKRKFFPLQSTWGWCKMPEKQNAALNQTS